MKGNLPGMYMVPTSITRAPGLIQDPWTNSGFPIAQTKISADFTYIDFNTYAWLKSRYANSQSRADLEFCYDIA